MEDWWGWTPNGWRPATPLWSGAGQPISVEGLNFFLEINTPARNQAETPGRGCLPAGLAKFEI